MISSRILLLCTVVALSACGDTREDLGLGRNMPDEFAVVERPPLSMPPDYGLRPPRPGVPRPQEVDTTQEASKALFSGASPGTSDSVSDGEKALLAATGAAKAQPDIRAVIDREAAQEVVASPHLVQRLLDSSDDSQPGVTVDAEAEAARIKKAQQDNQPLNQGATPVIEKQQQSGWLGL